MTAALLTLLAMCPSSDEATDALAQESWGAGLSVVIEAGSPSGLDVLLRRGDQVVRSGHLDLASDSCSLNLRGVVMAMHAWTRAIDLSSEAAAPVVPSVDVTAEPAPEAPQPARSAPARPAAPARRAHVRGPSDDPIPEAPRAAEPTPPASTLRAAAPEATLPEVNEATPATPPASHDFGIELDVLGGLALPGPFLDIDIRGAVTRGRWGVIAAGGTHNDDAANVSIGFVSVAGRVRFQPFERTGIDLVAGARLGDLLMQTRGLRPWTVGLTGAVEWHQRIIGPVSFVLAAEARALLNVDDAAHAPSSESSIVAAHLSAGVEAKVW